MSGLNKNTTAENNLDTNKKIVEKFEKSMGNRGCKWITDGTQNHVGNWYAIQGIESAILDMAVSIFDGKVDLQDNTVDMAIPNGAIIYIRARTFKLVSGKAIAYKY
jgi:hypothetical protein